jgi:sucrose-6-phosphate hydrolase SacC (GH32 family)
MRRFSSGSPAVVLLLASLARGDDFPKDLVHWKPSPEAPVFAGEGGIAWDKKIRERGWIVREGPTYHLWYTGYNDARSKDRLLGHATSRDGITWARDPGNPLLTGDWVEDVCVVKADGAYWMFAEGIDDIAHLLTSVDGRSWTELGPLDIRKVDGTPISAGPRGTPTAWFEAGVWYLFYERGDLGVWLATSRDRKTWTNVNDDPVLAMGPEPYDKAAVAFDQIFKRDGVYYAIYHANRERPWKDWSTCLARSKDLIHWEKYPGNPIVAGNTSSGMIVETPEGPRLYTMHPDVRRFAPDTPGR